MNLENLDLSSAFEIADVPFCTVEVLGELEPDDIAAALTRKASPAILTESGFVREDPEPDPRDLKKLRAKHHSVARLVASGLDQRMVASLCGYTESYLSILLNAPAMQELVNYYGAQIGNQHNMLGERLRRVGDAALDEIEERLEDKAKREALEMSELTSVAKLGFDRSGQGPSSQHHIVSENHIFDHAALRARDKAARQQSAERILPATPALPPPSDDSEENRDG